MGTKTTQLGLNHEDDVVPVVAFKERRSLRALSGLEEIQTHQRAGEEQPACHWRAHILRVGQLNQQQSEPL